MPPLILPSARNHLLRPLLGALAFWFCFTLCAGSSPAISAQELDYKHGYAFLKEPALPANFPHFNYVNPDAPKGGKMRATSQGTWDNFNILLTGGKGRIVDGISFWPGGKNLLYDSLMIPALDEPATYYGLLAEGIAVAEDRSWVAFKLNPKGRWHDGKPITVDDVVFTFEAIQKDGSPTIRSSFKPFTLEVMGPGEFRFHIAEELRRDASVIFTVSGFPILPKHYWEGRDLSKTTVVPPLGSGPYRIGKFSIGRWIEYERVEDYWAIDHPVAIGQNNFDVIKFDSFRDEQVLTEAVKGHIVDVREETVPRTWVSAYDTPATKGGHMKKIRVELLQPSGLWWPIFWNLEQARFQDIRVREALWLLTDMVWGMKRSYDFFGPPTSFFHGSELAATGLPSERELKLLEPLRDLIPPRVFTQPYEPQPNTGKGWSRKNLLRASELLKEAGWVIRDGKLVHGVTGEAFHIRLVAVSPALGSSFIPLTRLLKRLGISSSIKSPEISNWLHLMRSGDFDGGAVWFIPSYTPTLLINNSFASIEADKEYSSNWSNIRDPAIDSLIEAIKVATTWEDYVAAIRAFDRVMLFNYYWVPSMSNTRRALAYWDKFGIPEHGPLGRLTFIDNWWWDEDKAAKVNAFTSGND